jgi:hypothetical protein
MSKRYVRNELKYENKLDVIDIAETLYNCIIYFN